MAIVNRNSVVRLLYVHLAEHFRLQQTLQAWGVSSMWKDIPRMGMPYGKKLTATTRVNANKQTSLTRKLCTAASRGRGHHAHAAGRGKEHNHHRTVSGAGGAPEQEGAGKAFPSPSPELH